MRRSRCVVKLLGGIGRFERTCGVPVKLLGRDVGCILAVKLLGGRVRVVSWCCVP